MLGSKNRKMKIVHLMLGSEDRKMTSSARTILYSVNT